MVSGKENHGLRPQWEELSSLQDCMLFSTVSGLKQHQRHEPMDSLRLGSHSSRAAKHLLSEELKMLVQLLGFEAFDLGIPGQTGKTVKPNGDG